jgi:hypothetical protein
MESNEKYYARRALEELRAAERSLTPQGKARHRALAEAFLQKARQGGRTAMVSPAGFEPATY